MHVTHEPWLVVLSLIVAIQGAYVGLSLAVQVAGATGVRRRWLIAGAALSLGVAIWSMHFVGMLAARLPFPVDYLVFPTLLSFLVCVLVVGAAVFAATAGPLTSVRLAAAAVFMGLGIVSMHYIGMAALHASAHMTHAPAFVAASVVIAIATSGLALYLANTARGRTPLLLPAAALGLAISGMHYTAMAGMTIFPHEGAVSSAPALSVDLLAIVVAVVAFVVSGLFLLILLPERAEKGETAPLTDPSPSPGDRVDDRPIVRDFPSLASSSDAGAGRQEQASHIPVQQDGSTRFLPVASIVAVHANAHYTYVFDGTAKHFCPLPIGDIEARLDPSRFARVHRSHIIAIDRIVRLKRSGDKGLIELDGRDSYTVPVARGRLAWVKSQLVNPRPTRAAAT